MRLLTTTALAVALVIALACGGGGSSVGVSSTVGGMTLTDRWETLDPELSGGTVTAVTDESLVVSFSGDGAAIGDAFAEDLEASGWEKSYDSGHVAGSRTMQFKNGGVTVGVAISEAAGTVYLSATIDGDPPAASGSSTKAAPASAPTKPAATAAPTAPAAAPTKDCHDDVWWPCHSACGDEGWSCKTSCDNSVTGPCADACAETQYACEKACDELKWACEG